VIGLASPVPWRTLGDLIFGAFPNCNLFWKVGGELIFTNARSEADGESTQRYYSTIVGNDSGINLGFILR
jgi:hypothetical protein